LRLIEPKAPFSAEKGVNILSQKVKIVKDKLEIFKVKSKKSHGNAAFASGENRGCGSGAANPRRHHTHVSLPVTGASQAWGEGQGRLTFCWSIEKPYPGEVVN